MVTKTLLLVDGSSYLYRAFHAIKPLSAPDGTPTHAILGVLNMLRKTRELYPDAYCACVFDAKGKTFRHEISSDYKATRPPMPETLRPQANILPTLTRLLGWKTLIISGVEADDVIGTLAHQADQKHWRVIISTGDKDMAQLVNERIHLLDTMKKETLDGKGVFQKFGVFAHQICDFLSLTGDKSDNVAGVMNCGPKTAAKWLAEYQTLENLIAHAHQIQGKIGDSLRAAIPFLPRSHKLVTIKTDVDLTKELPNGLESLTHETEQWHELIHYFHYFNFKEWTQIAENSLKENNILIQKNPEFNPFSHSDHAHSSHSTLPSTQTDSNPLNSIHTEILKHYPIQTPEHLTIRPDIPKQIKLIYSNIQNLHDWQIFSEAFKHSKLAAIYVECDDNEHYLSRKIKGLGISSLQADHILSADISFAENLELNQEYIDSNAFFASLAQLLAQRTCLLITHDFKRTAHALSQKNIFLNQCDSDLQIVRHLLDSSKKNDIADLTKEFEHVYDLSEFAKETPRAALAAFILRCETFLFKNETSANEIFIYEKIERPLTQILFEMEKNGVLINPSELITQSTTLRQKLKLLEQNCYARVGEVFNLNSPKQLQYILFDRLNLPQEGIKKTSTGQRSTDEESLEILSAHASSDLPKILLEYRHLSKIKSTYTDKLPNMVNAKTGRVHTHFHQAGTLTGRLASKQPNVQNIPIRTPEGEAIRRAFTSPEHNFLLSADYSQIELRILAHLSNDPNLIEAFKQNKDIHQLTAAKLFNLNPEEINSEQRRYAKTINFGLIYGMSAFGLANNLNINQNEAKLFIERYFNEYPTIKNYMESIKQFAREHKYIQTLFGRKIYLPAISAKNKTIQLAAERTAINAPMQGTAAELIKLAMIHIQHYLTSKKLNTKLCLQIHDELIFEVPEYELEEIKIKIPELMERVGDSILSVPLVAQVGIGKTWFDAH